ncbi:adenosylcobinamide-GDP ribazoletransferase [Photobacterium aphoticum]|uniref:Adenosylcobinamide-GDP ribazoletransferase n=1 Tax=Photobacterium aphoticum TaxID=754436 RepID=A0A0J1JLJ6_9GAMM|nr:adenosylcobinamide-GDP ribazoletransferase [Photobacterium aphoticum]KLV02977.1 cobalamin synthase [Photobacterium aphoticum]PSU57905.1 adenosylcobinamide-GDP ribazoletransferase [Photobacterium aphoticum]GHA60200.1 adenosylcobinamide-GDP ribazoletransferase [Photobacterium aphoticum]
MMKQQWQIFLVALAFFTRIPIPADTPYSPDRLNQANRYFALVGIVVGLISAVAFWLAHCLFPAPIAVLIAMATSLLVTGAFHEDGLADVFDGFGGGWEPAQKLDIMKDSRLGTYGAAALFVALAMKWASLTALADVNPMYTVIALISLHGLSRAVAASLIVSYPYVRLDEQSKVKPLANQQSPQDLWVLIFTSLIILLFLPLSVAVALTVVLLLVRTLCGRWFQRQLGGYTGDCLGAAQQIAELCGYLVLLTMVAH